MNRWDVKARRDINYRSLSPIISLLSCHHTPGSHSQDESSNLKLFSAECQVWASWALANLTQWDEAKYCPLVAKEGGVEGIQGILARCAAVQSHLVLVSEEIFTFREVNGSPSPLRDKLLMFGKMTVRNIETWRRADIGQVEPMLRD